MDIPLKKPRNTRWIRLRRYLWMGVGLFSLVFGIGALPLAFLYFAADSSNSPTERQASSEVKQLQAKQKQIVAFVDVNVVPMDEERVMAGQTVIVRDGVIAALGPTDKIKVPAGALRIDGRGKYLMPGLADNEALRTATANAAEFLRTDKFGTVSVGKTADLILVEGDPLKDVNNASRRTGVMTRGRWFTEDELRKMLDGMAASYAQR